MWKCVWCGQKCPDTPQEVMEMEPCSNDAGDGHLYKNFEEYTQEQYDWEKETGRCSVCGRLVLECVCE